MFDEIDANYLETLYQDELRFKSVESVLDLLSEDIYNAVKLLRFTRFTLKSAAMAERQFKALDYATVLSQAGVVAATAEKIEKCFEQCFDFNAYLSSKNFEDLEMFLIKKDIVISALEES